MSSLEQNGELVPMKVVFIDRVASPSGTSSYCYSVIFVTKETSLTNTYYDLDAVYSAISDFYKETI